MNVSTNGTVGFFLGIWSLFVNNPSSHIGMGLSSLSRKAHNGHNDTCCDLLGTFLFDEFAF